MSRRKLLRGKRNKITIRYEAGRPAGTSPASRDDRDWQSATKHFIRVSSTQPGKGK